MAFCITFFPLMNLSATATWQVILRSECSFASFVKVMKKRIVFVTDMQTHLANLGDYFDNLFRKWCDIYS